MVTHRDGRILSPVPTTSPRSSRWGSTKTASSSLPPTIPVPPRRGVGIYRNGTLLQTVSVPRTAQTYRNRFTEQGRQQMQLKVGATAYTFHIDVVESGIDVSEATYGLQVKS